MKISSVDLIYFVVICVVLLICNLILFTEIDNFVSLEIKFDSNFSFVQDHIDRWEHIGNSSFKFQFYSAYFDERKDTLCKLIILEMMKVSININFSRFQLPH